MPIVSTAELYASATELSNSMDMVIKEIENSGVEIDLVLVVLNGGFILAADFVRKFRLNVQVEFIRFQPYSTGVKIPDIMDVIPQIEHKNILVIDDVLDSGETLSLLIEALQYNDAKSVRTLVAVDKKLPTARLESDYCLVVGNGEQNFLWGYGMDAQGGYERGNPHIIIREPAAD